MSTYCLQADIETYYGRNSVAQWADLNSGGAQSEIDARIAAAIAAASDEINARMRGGPYTVPFSDDPDTPATIRRVAVWLAGYDLYNPRGAQDFTAEGESVHRLSGDRDRALKAMAEIHAGVMELDLDPICDQTIPEVVHVDTTRDDDDSVIGQDELDNWS